MKTRNHIVAKTIKACGLKSVGYVADKNEVDRKTIYNDFNSNKERFKERVLFAIDSESEEKRERAELILGAL
jgi:hypothetical protein